MKNVKKDKVKDNVKDNGKDPITNSKRRIIMTHDFSTVFDTDNPLWQRVLEIYAANEKYDKKIVSGRNLHHKFPRSFSKKLGEPIDNDKDNLISLSLADHFLVHYYYYKLAKKGYRQSMATAFTFMAKKSIKYMSPDTAEMIAKDYEEANEEAKQHSEETRRKISETNKGKHHSEDSRKKMSESHKGKHLSEEHRRKLSESLKGKLRSAETRRKLSESMKGENNPNYGKQRSEETRKKLSEVNKGKHLSEETRRKISESRKGRK